MLEELRKLICEYVEVEEGDITEDSRLMEDLGFNSFDFMGFIGEAEEHFQVAVEESEIVKVRTVKDIVEYLTSLK